MIMQLRLIDAELAKKITQSRWMQTVRDMLFLLYTLLYRLRLGGIFLNFKHRGW